MNNNRPYNIAFYAIVAAGFIFILFSYPFLNIGYDQWGHIYKIASVHNQGLITEIEYQPSSPRLWHQIWAEIFHITGINDVYLWAKIIHTFHFFLSSAIIYFFSKTVLTILMNAHTSLFSQNDKEQGLKNVEESKSNSEKILHIKFLSLFSILIWFIGNGTFSGKYQSSWIMWYSTTYQGLTLPLFWFCTALILKIFHEKLKTSKTIWLTVLIALSSFVIAIIHPMELQYFLIHLLIIFLININKLITKKRELIFVFIPIIALLMIIIINYFIEFQPRLFRIIPALDSIGQILHVINTVGQEIIQAPFPIRGSQGPTNRFPNTFSEIALVSLIAALVFSIFYYLRREKIISINKNIFNYLLLSSSLFFLLPMVPFFAGLCSFMSDKKLVYRYFFASPWFILMPFLIYIIMVKTKKDKPFYNVIIINVMTILLIIFISKSFNIFVPPKYHYNHTLYRNVRSIVNSLDKEKVGYRYILRYRHGSN